MSTSHRGGELERLRARAYGDEGPGLTAEELRRLETLEAREHPAGTPAHDRVAAPGPEHPGAGGPAAERRPARRGRIVAAVVAAVLVLLAAGAGLGLLWDAVRAGTPGAELPEFSTLRTDEDHLGAVPAEIAERVDIPSVRYVALIGGVAVRIARSHDGEVCLLGSGRVPGGWALECGASGVQLDVGAQRVAVRPVPAGAEVVGWLSPSVALVAPVG
jgi:hypothetical protein